MEASDRRSPRRLTRRTTLGLGALGLLGAGVGGTAAVRQLTDGALDPVAGGSLVQPEVLRSRAGVLDVRLRAAAGTHRVAGRSAQTLGYNGGVPGPTLVVRPGDTLRIQLVNELADATNLHVHGLHVSPEGRGDNVFAHVGPGATRQYEYRLPDDHPPGTYWYHPHIHGTVAEQVFGGLYGAIVVRDTPEEASPRADRERVLVISDISLDDEGRLVEPSRRDQMRGREGDLVLVNGQARPALSARAGTRERWRIVNACSSRFLSLELPGQRTHVLGRDLGRLVAPTELESVVLAPGNRLDLLVDLQQGSTALRTRTVDRGAMHDMGDMGDMGGMGVSNGESGGDDGPRTLLDLRVDAGTSRPPNPPAPPRDVRDLREEPVAGRRTLAFGAGMGGMMSGDGMEFTFGGAAFDPDRTDQRVAVGTVEEWVITNDTEMDHPFHLHVWPMQVLEVAGERQREPLWLDVVNVPARGRVTVRVPFEDFGGRTVYHCHILDHEDRGMMGTVEAT